MKKSQFSFFKLLRLPSAVPLCLQPALRAVGWFGFCWFWVYFHFLLLAFVSVDVRSSEYNLEEIDEREEISVQQGEDSESTNTSPRIGEVTAAFSSAEVPLENDKNDPASSAPIPGSVSVDNSQSFKEEKQENMSTDGK